jgi:hypothetical protein
MINQPFIRLSSWILLLTLAASFSACNSESLRSRTKFLTEGTWSFDDIKRGGLDEDSRTTLLVLWGNLDYEFNEDGSFEVTLIDTTENVGEWLLNRDADKLTILADGVTETYRIIELTRESLVYAEIDSASRELTYYFTKD